MKITLAANAMTAWAGRPYQVYFGKRLVSGFRMSVSQPKYQCNKMYQPRNYG
jgi:hypothetical protein